MPVGQAFAAVNGDSVPPPPQKIPWAGTKGGLQATVTLDELVAVSVAELIFPGTRLLGAAKGGVAVCVDPYPTLFAALTRT